MASKMFKLSKAKQALTRLKQLDSSDVYLQENRLLSDELLKLRKRWPGQVISAFYLSQTEGLMNHRSVPFKVDKVIRSIGGTYLILGEILISELTNMKNVYGQKEDNITLL